MLEFPQSIESNTKLALRCKVYRINIVFRTFKLLSHLNQLYLLKDFIEIFKQTETEIYANKKETVA